MPEMDLLPDLGNLLHLLWGQIRELLHRGQRWDTLDAARGGDNGDVLGQEPQGERGVRVDWLACLGGQPLGDALEDRLDRPAGRVSQERGERSVRLEADSMLVLDLLDGFEVGQDVRVVLDLWPRQRCDKPV